MKRKGILAEINQMAMTVALTASAAFAAGDMVIANFEGDNYGDWTVEGQAFGAGPAGKALHKQQQLFSMRGKGCVTSFHGGDKATGKLISPEFTIENDYINFRVGGTTNPGRAGLNLIVEGKIVRSATGSSTLDHHPRHETLKGFTWDIKEFKGKKARLEIVDTATNENGHINVDQIIASDEKFNNSEIWRERVNAKRTINLTGKLLLLPIRKDGGPDGDFLTITVDGVLVYKYGGHFSSSPNNVMWWAHLDLSEYVGKQAELTIEAAAGDKVLEMMESSDKERYLKPVYTERLRPQLRYSQRTGWNNDTNGMVYYDGEYHLFYQHNPLNRGNSNMSWGHAVSKDLLYWEELRPVLRPFGRKEKNRHPAMAVGSCFSGSCNVDVDNTAGLQKGAEKTIVAFFTDTTVGEAMAFSTDRARNFTYWSRNPVLKHPGRDPKVIWYESGKHWVMVVFHDESRKYKDNKEMSHCYAFYTSKDMKNWEQASLLHGWFECPEFVELPIDNDENNKRWVLIAAGGEYVTGVFDGRKFTPDTKDKLLTIYGAYGGQCFSRAPNGRAVYIGFKGWDHHSMGDDAPFNKGFTLPLEFSLRSTAAGPRLFAEPVKELERLRQKELFAVKDQRLSGDKTQIKVETDGQLFDIVFTLKAKGKPNSFTLNIGKTPVKYDFNKQVFPMGKRLVTPNGKCLNNIDMDDHSDPDPRSRAPLDADGEITFRVIVDRPFYEVFAAGGATYLMDYRKDEGEPIKEISLSIDSGAGSVMVKSFKIFKMKSIWKK